MKPLALIYAASFAFKVLGSAVNEPCVGASGRLGVCVDELECKSAGGSTISNACPGTPDSVKCCTKASCGSSIQAFLGTAEQEAVGAGNCRWASDCNGSSISNHCPGPIDFRCCQSSDPGCGGYSQPPRFGQGGCQQVAIKGAEAIITQFPGSIREVGCKRDPGSHPSDHDTGHATDMMCSDRLNQPTMCGREIVEWVMNHQGALNLRYVIWGQRIWNPSRDSVKEWTSWRDMDDRRSVQQNHWDHVHISYNR